MSLRIQKLIVAGESGGSVPALRKRLETNSGMRQVFDHHGMTEVGPVTFESPGAPRHLIVIEDAYFAEVVDPVTGLEVEDGQHGELVLTTLDRTVCPLLRYRTGDYVKKKLHRGRLTLEGGILSRIDDMVVLRGVNIYPSAIDAVVCEFPEVVEYIVEQKRIDDMDEIELLIETDRKHRQVPHQKARNPPARYLQPPHPRARRRPDTLPRHEFKAKRWKVL
jgi:phenylacetate-CoA ligase